MKVYEIILSVLIFIIAFLTVRAIRWVIKNTKLVVKRQGKEDLVIAGGKVIKDENKTNS